MAATQLSDAICRAFTVAFLLSGNRETAESVLHEAIASLDVEDLSSDALMICVCMLAVHESAQPGEPGGEPGGEMNTLPEELQHVLALPPMLRYCFVLRLIVGLPVNVCASLLQTGPGQISAAQIAACQLLACGQYEYEPIAGPGGSARVGRVDGERSHHA